MLASEPEGDVSMTAPSDNDRTVMTSGASVRARRSRNQLRMQAATVAAFVCSYNVYGQVAHGVPSASWRMLGGALCFVLLFLQLRLVDDLDDLKHDFPALQTGGRRMVKMRCLLRSAIVVCIGVNALLNATETRALLAAGVATAITFAGPFGVKRWLPTQLGIGAIVFEAAPFSFFSYAYFYWRDAGNPALPVSVVLCAIVVFWSGYEFWKFSRKLYTEAFQPYFLKPPQIRVVLNALLVVALIANIGLAMTASFSRFYLIYAAMLPAGLLLWMNSTWTITLWDVQRMTTRRPLWSGLTLVAAIEVGLIVERLAAWQLHITP
jgi:hypothetical protein